MRGAVPAAIGLAIAALALAACVKNDSPPAADQAALRPAGPRLSAIPPADARLEDREIRLTVERALRTDHAVASRRIDVGVSDGVVTLKGTIGNLRSHRRATAVAESVKGVRAVVNRLAVVPARRADAAIADNVRKALAADPVAAARTIGVAVEHGEVTLRGEVSSYHERRLIEAVVTGVRGVSGIDSELAIVYDGEVSDQAIERAVASRLRHDVLVDDSLILIGVDEGVVRLRGSVGSAAERTTAALDAWVKGTKGVKNELDVRWWARDRMRRKRSARKSDKEIASAVRDALRYDPRVVSHLPRVAVDKGVVTLRGTVNHLAAKIAAEADARNTVGVVLVVNELKVEPKRTVADALTSQRVQLALDRDPLLSRYDLDGHADSGVATLQGMVASAYDKRLAESLVSKLPGVVSVVNQLIVNPPLATFSDQEIARQVRDELFWSPWVEHEDIRVRVERGVVTLRGRVHSLMERRAAVAQARQGGAAVVVDKLKMTPAG